MALAELRKGEEAWRLLQMIDPVRRAGTAAGAALYKVEPYVMAADVNTAAGRAGQGGWTWYTGSAGWMRQLLVDKLLGLTRERDTLSFASR